MTGSTRARRILWRCPKIEGRKPGLQPPALHWPSTGWGLPPGMGHIPMNGAASFSWGQGLKRDTAGSHQLPKLPAGGRDKPSAGEGATLVVHHSITCTQGHKLGKRTEPKRLRIGVSRETLKNLISKGKIWYLKEDMGFTRQEEWWALRGEETSRANTLWSGKENLNWGIERAHVI